MSEQQITAVVFDCTVFAQALINPRGPAGLCFTAAQQGRVRLFISDYILLEVRELPGKLPARLGVTSERVELLIRDLAKYAEPVERIESQFIYERDPDDAHYVNLAIACGAFLVVSRDKDLLDLMKDGSKEGVALRERHAAFRVMSPPEFLTILAPG